MERKEVSVKQVMYEGFTEFDGIEMATATNWWNGEGIEVFIQKKAANDIQVSLTHSDIALLRKMFSDFDF